MNPTAHFTLILTCNATGGELTAIPAVSADVAFIRTDTHLISLGGK